VAHVPEDRHRRGLVLNFHAWENTALGYHNDAAYNPTPWKMDNDAIIRDTSAKMAAFDVRPPDPQLKASGFSGGNQQKIVLAREIEHAPDVLLGRPAHARGRYWRD
jgi:general nucleoside transport system ATP-binding protein